MVGDSTDTVWGVIDLYLRTDFPDIRKKAVIHSAAGSALLIPREGDALARFYVEQPPGTVAADLTLERLLARLRLVLAPFQLDAAAVAWWSAYAIGQRAADAFHRARRVFLTGDAAHTHSPKAGQGMNVSLQDGYNLGWKLAAVLGPLAARPELLDTYVAERAATAEDLVAFDRELTRLFSSRYRREHAVSAAVFAEHFVRAGRYTAGQATRYAPSLIVSGPPAAAAGGRAGPGGLVLGMRFPSAQVVRFSDAKPVQLLRALPSDGRWRFVVFGGDIHDVPSREKLDKVRSTLSFSLSPWTPTLTSTAGAGCGVHVDRGKDVQRRKRPGQHHRSAPGAQVRSLASLAGPDPGLLLAAEGEMGHTE